MSMVDPEAGLGGGYFGQWGLANPTNHMALVGPKFFMVGPKVLYGRWVGTDHIELGTDHIELCKYNVVGGVENGVVGSALGR